MTVEVDLVTDRPRRSPLRTPGADLSGTVAELVAKVLVRHGVEVIFGQSLPSALHLAAEHMGIRQIAYRTENAGGYMADGYARMKGVPAVVTAQNGPAATLLVPPLAEAMKSSVPLVALVQDIAQTFTEKNAFQELDHLRLFDGCSKWTRVVNHVDRVDDYLELAFTIACSGRPGPTALLFPADLLNAVAPPSSRDGTITTFPADRPRADRAEIEAAAQILAQAQRPVVIAGGGVHLSRAHDSLALLQEQYHLPVATTLMGKGAVAESHPLSVGVVGYFMGPRGATHGQRELITDADVVLLVGTRTNQNGTDSYQLYPKNAIYLHVDIDGAEVGRNYDARRLVGDARATLDELIGALSETDLRQLQGRRSRLEAQIREGKALFMDMSAEVRLSDASPLRPERIMSEINQILTDDTVVVSDASYSSIWVGNYITARRAGQRFLSPRGLAGLGWGFPMAIGANLARPDAPIICIVGDGGFGHVWSEMETARRVGAPVALVVLNNSILGYQKHAENVKFGEHTTAVDLLPVDHAALARAVGCEGIRVDQPSALKEALIHASQSARLTVIDAVCDPDAYPPITSFGGID